jgi:hypothetical protein
MGPNVRFQGWSGRHLLIVSISPFDPSAELASSTAMARAKSLQYKDANGQKIALYNCKEKPYPFVNFN